MSSYFGSTKFWLAIGVLVATYVLVLIGKMDANQWITVALGAAGIYSGSNVLDKVSDKT